MKQNKITSQIIIFGVVIICIFTYVATINLIDNNSSNKYYAKDKKIDGRIDNYYINDNKLVVEISGNIKDICIKTTRSIPDTNSICWNNVNDGRYSISIYDYKTYYIWIRDINGNVSESVKYNSK